MASIKRIIAEPPSGATREGDPDGPDVLELGATPLPEAAPARAAAPARWDVEAPTAVRAPDPLPDDPAPLISPAAREATQRAMAALTGVAIDPAAAANTLDGLVREMLRPMLKEWLDVNLPELVERVVAREVARLGGR